MESLSQDNPSANDVRAYLETVLPDSRLADVVIDSTYQPLLLLQTEHIVAAFAFSNADIRKSYDALYGCFKKHYSEQRGQWDALEIAFVFCVQPGLPDLDHFCSNVETDVYFCRKFVIALVLPLGMALASLPFLPLTPVHTKSLRPPSAQTFLRQRGVPALLAKYLVVPHERSPEGIVEDCTSGKFGKPRNLSVVDKAQVVQADLAFEPIRLQTVSIQNFRVYRKTQKFEIGADVTVLYGPNGFGKTSFFDAVDFAMTGGIGRIASSSEAHFARIARHLDSKSEDSEVSLSFLCNGVSRKVTRTVRDRKQALLDDQPTDRKGILAELTGGNIPAADQRIENLVSLFRATHLFSQEQQELTKDFQDDCRLSGQIVSRMLAFEDYANAVNKVAKVREVSRGKIANANNEIRELSEEIASGKNELDRLGGTTTKHTGVRALDAEFEELRAKLVAAEIAAAPQKPEASVVRSWRASLESRLSESQSRTIRFSVLAQEAAALPRMNSDFASLQQQLSQTERALNAAEEKRIAAEQLFHRAEQRFAEVKAKCEEAQARVQTLGWVLTNRPVYTQLVEEQRMLGDALKAATNALLQHRQDVENATRELRTLETFMAEVTGKLETKRAELLEVRSLFESIVSWQANRARLDIVMESEGSVMKSLESLRVDERELLPHVTEAVAEEARMSRQIAEVDKSQSEVKTLLSQLQGHVRSGRCPLCGEDHGAKDELIRRIQKSVAADSASGLRADLTDVRERAKQLVDSIESIRHKQQTAAAQRVDLRNERVKLTAEIGNFENSLRRFGITIEVSGTSPEEQLQARRDQVESEIRDLNGQVQATDNALKIRHTVLQNASSLSAEKTGEVMGRQARLKRLGEEIYRLRDNPRSTQFSLDIEQLAELERQNCQSVAAFNAEAVNAEVELAQKKAGMVMLRQESASIKSQLQTLRAKLTNLQGTIMKIGARLNESNLPSDATEEMLLALIAEESRMQAQILALRDSTSNLELAIDAATTAAALTRLLEDVRHKEKAVATAAHTREQHQPWLKYFDELSRLLSSQQNEAIANFTREYGPRTSVIQRRLRSVYGFDQIEILSRESTIYVRVKRQGEELRPIDYFSQSQQQTLLLGLFITACSSQTWSAFSPVFLDDPVTHFDDLNTYAFLDLIVGLLESNIGKRQFVISTCDSKLFQLARKKFRHLRERARFYRFSAISESGPVIDKIALP